MEDNGSKDGRSVQARSIGPDRRGEGGELSFLIKKLRENKVEYFKDGDFEIKFSHLAFIPDEDLAANAKDETNKDEPIDDLLFYSSVDPRGEQ